MQSVILKIAEFVFHMQRFQKAPLASSQTGIDIYYLGK